MEEMNKPRIRLSIKVLVEKEYIGLIVFIKSTKKLHLLILVI